MVKTYSRYINDMKLDEAFTPANMVQPSEQRLPQPKETKTSLFKGLFGGLDMKFDTTDIILLLIILLLFMEGDETELLITMALVVFLGL